MTYRARYQAFGAPLDGWRDGAGYTKHVMDSASELVYMPQRYYDPATLRFISTDPVSADPTNFNRFWYANNNPDAYTDPDGRQALRSYHDGVTCPPACFDKSASEGSAPTPRSSDSLASVQPPMLMAQAEDGERSDRTGNRNRRYEKPTNPNKRPPPEHRRPSGERERNVGHENAEEHSRRPKGGFRVKLPIPILICPGCEGILNPNPLDQFVPEDRRGVPYAFDAPGLQEKSEAEHFGLVANDVLRGSNVF